MTVTVAFFAERAFFRFIKQSLEANDSAIPIEQAVACVVAAVAALEATVNSFFVADGRLEHYDELRLVSKIETLADWYSLTIDWGSAPWQDVKSLLRTRNWLVHFKEPLIGLARSSRGWVDDGSHKPPKLDPYEEFSRERIVQYRDSTVAAIHALAAALHPNLRDMISLEDDPFFVG